MAAEIEVKDGDLRWQDAIEAQGALWAALDAATGGAWLQAIQGQEQKPLEPPAVYGPGRGLFLSAADAEKAIKAGKIEAPGLQAQRFFEARGNVGPAPIPRGDAGVWVMARGPLGLRQSANQINGEQRPTFHCSSFTNWIAGIYTGADAKWTHGGTMADLPDLVMADPTLRIPVKHPNGSTTYTDLYGYGAHATPVQIGKRAQMTPLEVWGKRGELGLLTLAAQASERGKGRWIEHHTVCIMRVPGQEDRLYRVAADGYKKNGRYSGTVVNVEVWTEEEAKKATATQRLRCWTFLTTPAGPRCPVVREI